MFNYAAEKLSAVAKIVFWIISILISCGYLLSLILLIVYVRFGFFDTGEAVAVFFAGSAIGLMIATAGIVINYILTLVFLCQTYLVTYSRITAETVSKIEEKLNKNDNKSNS